MSRICPDQPTSSTPPSPSSSTDLLFDDILGAKAIRGVNRDAAISGYRGIDQTLNLTRNVDATGRVIDGRNGGPGVLQLSPLVSNLTCNTGTDGPSRRS